MRQRYRIYLLPHLFFPNLKLSSALVMTLISVS